MKRQILVPPNLSLEETVAFVTDRIKKFNGEALPCRLRVQSSGAPIAIHLIRSEDGVAHAAERVLGTDSLFSRRGGNIPIFLDLGQE